MNTYQRALRNFQDYSDDVSRSRFNTFDDAIRRFVSTLAPGTPLGAVVAQLPRVDFDTWFDALQPTGSMVGSGVLRWPDDSMERLSMQVELIRRIAAERVSFLDFITNFLWVGNDFGDNTAEFVQHIFRPFVRDLLRLAHDTPLFASGLQSSAPEEQPLQGAGDLDVFISHSSADALPARALVALFEKGLKISARSIRCTSVDGFRLPVGADTDEVLRAEVFCARLFVALLTPNSLQSPYVLFELGARWGARKPLFPLLARGSTPADLPSPLDRINALSTSEPDQVRQLIEDASGALSKRLEPLAAFSAEVDAVVSASRSQP